MADYDAKARELLSCRDQIEVDQLAKLLGVEGGRLIMELMAFGVMATTAQPIEMEVAQLVADAIRGEKKGNDPENLEMLARELLPQPARPGDPTSPYPAQQKSYYSEQQVLDAVVAALRKAPEENSYLKRQMKVVWDFLEPNESSDMDWADEVIIAIRNRIQEARGHTVEQGILEEAMDWIHGGDTGLSSESICFHMLGKPSGGNYPLDPSDLGRCLRLLVRFPQWRPRIHEMARYSKQWEVLASRWDELECMMRNEVGIDWSKGRSAPKTYKFIRALIENVNNAG